MGTTDSIPVVSQAKSLVQSVCGDNPGAERTQQNFVHECPVVSQVTSAVELLTGDRDGAIETQKRCGRNLMRAADGIPLVGHVKGVVHYTVGDKEGGHQAMKASTRTTGVMAAGAGGFVVGGPVAAVASGVIAGAEMDMLTTAVTGEDAGYVAAIDNAIKNPNPGDLFDLALMPVGDGLAGYGAGELVKSAQQPGGMNKTTAAHPPDTSASSNVLGNTQMASRLEMETYLVLESAQAGTSKASLNAPGFYRLATEDTIQKMFDSQNKVEGSLLALKEDASAPPESIELNAINPQERRSVDPSHFEGDWDPTRRNMENETFVEMNLTKI